MAGRNWTTEDVRASNERERGAQGLPSKVTEQSVIHKVAALLTAGRTDDTTRGCRPGSVKTSRGVSTTAARPS